MWQFFEAAFAAIPAAASNPYAFGAYALAILAYVITAWRVARNKNLLEHIEKLPPKDRLSALEIETGGVRLAKGISPEQWVRSRTHKYYLFAFLATCAVAVVVVTLAMLKGAGYVQVLTIINNQYQLLGGSAPSGPDLQRIENLVKALVARDTEDARTSFESLSETGRAAYQRALQSVDRSVKDILIPVEQLIPGPRPVPSPTASVREIEPNDDILNASNVPLNATVSAAIESSSDADFFSFTVPGNRRDRIDVILTNDSTTLAPRLTLYKADKSRLDSVYNSTDGADLSYTLTAQPNTRYYVGVAPYKGRGSYRLTVRAQNAYDQYEPNDDILNSSPIVIGTAIEANILDAADWDFYHFETKNVAKVVVSLENRSTTLAPRITAYKPDKSQLGTMYNSTNGANLSYAFAVQSNSRYYFRVGPYNGHGKYALTVQPE